MTIVLVLSILGIMLASLGGVLFLWKFMGDRLIKFMPYLISGSAGLFVVVCYSLYQETFEFLEPSKVVTWIGAGFAGFTLLTLLVPDGHHHIDDNHNHNHAGMAKRILFGDAIHNIADGVLLVPAFLIDYRLGVATAVGIFIHEFIQELSEFIILKDAGYSTKKALLANLAVSTTIFIGVGISILLSSDEEFVGPILGISTGAFAFLVIYDLFPRMFTESRNANRYFVFLSFITGASLLIVLNLLVSG